MNYQSKYKYVKKGWNSKYRNINSNLRSNWKRMESHTSTIDRGIKSINPILGILSNMLRYGKLSKRIVL